MVRLRFWPRRLRYRVVLVIAGILFVPYIASRVASPWRRLTVHGAKSVEVQDANHADSKIRVACFNIAHGRGVAESNWNGGGYEERLARLDEIAKLLRRIDADVVVLNEVDFDSSWSHSINQAAYLAEHADYAYFVEQRNLDFRFLIWKWRFGNAILSRLPIQNAEVIELPSYSFFESLLAGKKRAVACDVTLGQQKFRVIGAHFSHRSEAVRVGSAKHVIEAAGEKGISTVLCGDLNSTPSDLPGSLTNLDGENAAQLLLDSGRFLRHPATCANHPEFMTFHSTDPKLAIDWILASPGWRFDGFTVDPTVLSDHRAVFADLVIQSK